MMALKLKPHHHGTSVGVHFLVANDDSRNSLTFKDAGTLTLPLEVWDELFATLTRGARRPLLVIFEEEKSS